ncbi:hypothetical protein PVAP13_9NG375542 [Panicum virgatum]|uniref:Uncharacterized protein n=1 Tax=Panicum virgatum TaxID=38727 RepID=A0A8T0MW27_PANVG|nr:hypothetical protein PVAP13_9NG375542 [Panicum virgatum]
MQRPGGFNRRPEMEAHFARKRVKSPLQNAGKGGESSPKKRRLTTRWEAKAKVSCSPNAADQSGIQRPEMEAHFARKRVKSPLQNAGKGGESSPKKRRLTYQMGSEGEGQLLT